MKNKLKIIYAGTPEFSVPTLEILTNSNLMISHILTQPDQKAGRGMKLLTSPLKKKALELGIPVLQPNNLKDDFIFEKIKSIKADILLVAAYGIIIPQKILDLFPIETLNIHASLLPKWRGAAPIQRAIQAGDAKLGVTIMKIVEKLDAGPMACKAEIINDNLTTEIATKELALLGANLIKEVLEDLNNGKTISWKEQNESLVTYAEKIKKEEALIDFNDNAENLARKINAFNPFPGVRLKFRDKLLKIWKAKPMDRTSPTHKYGYFFIDKKRLLLGLAKSSIEIIEIQIEGKSKMSAQEFVSGYQINQQEKIFNE